MQSYDVYEDGYLKKRYSIKVEDVDKSHLACY